MASKRPQRASGQTTSYGVQQNQIGVTASGVDTFVQPGLANAPAAPIQAAQPVAPDDQGIKDQLALAKSFNMLSGSAAQLGEADASGYGKMEEFGAEMVELQKQMESTGLVFADEVSKGTLDAMQHPAALLGQANAMSTNAANAFSDRMNAERDTFRANNPDALNMDLTMARWDTGIQSVDTPTIGRADVFDRNLIVAQSTLRQGYEARHREWLSERVLDESRLAVQESVGSIVDNAAIFKLDPVVQSGFNMNQYPGSTIGPIIAPTSEENFDAAVEQAAVSITQMLDEGRGGLHVPNEMHELIGIALVDIAANEDDPHASKIAEAILLKTETGQKNARTKLWEVGSVNKYYRDRKDTIAAHQASSSKAAGTKQFQSYILSYKNQLTQQLTQMRHNSDSRLNTNEWKKVFFRDFQESLIIEQDGMTMVKDGDTIKFTTEEGYTGQVNFDDVVSESDDMYYQQVYDKSLQILLNKNERVLDAQNAGTPTDEEYVPFPEATAHALSAAQSNISSDVLSASFKESWQLINASQMGVGDERDAEHGLAAFTQAIHAYSALESFESRSLIERHIPDPNTRDFFAMAHLALNNNTAATLLNTGTIDSLYQRVSMFTSLDVPKMESIQAAWTEADGDGLVEDFMGDEMIANRGVVTQEIKNVARLLNFVNATPLDDAITLSVDMKKKSMVSLGGVLVEKESIDPNILAGFIPIDGPGTLPKVQNDQLFGSIDRAIENSNPGETMPTGVHGSAEERTWVGDAARMWWSLLYHSPDAVTSVGKPILRGIGIPGMGSDEEDETLSEIMNNVAMHYVKSRSSSKRDINISEALDAATERMDTNPPKWWAAENQVIGSEFVGFQAVGRGSMYMALVKGPEGLITPFGNSQRNGMPFTIDEIVGLGDWDNIDGTWSRKTGKNKVRSPRQDTKTGHPLHIQDRSIMSVGGLSMKEQMENIPEDYEDNLLLD